MELINCAIIENNTVVNVVAVESLEKAIEIFGLQVINVTNGWDYNNGIDGGVFFPVPQTEQENI